MVRRIRCLRLLPADDLLEELIAKNAEPKRLLVVSSDHRVQRAARQAGAEYIDSEVYWRQVRSRPAGANDRGETSADKPASPAAEEVADWLREFRGGE
jgi:predicted RNA-binding protein with PIN domain